MNNKEQIQKRIKELELQRKEYDFIVKKLFDDPSSITLEESKQFVEDNKEKVLELKKISKEIADLRWQLMTPQEQKDYLDKYSED